MDGWQNVISAGIGAVTAIASSAFGSKAAPVASSGSSSIPTNAPAPAAAGMNWTPILIVLGGVAVAYMIWFRR